MKRSSIPASLALAAAAVCVAIAAMASSCAGGSPDESTTTLVSEGGSSTTKATPPSSSTVTSLDYVTKAVDANGTVTLGNAYVEGFAIALPANAYPGVADVRASVAPSVSAPPMTTASLLGDGYEVDTGGVGRLDNPGTFTFRYNPAVLADDSLLVLAYFDGFEWVYTFASAFDETANTVSFPLFHFSAYYPAHFKNELEAGKYYAARMAAQKVLGEGGGDPHVGAQALADLITAKLGLGENEFATGMMAGIAADPDIIKVFDEAQTQGWTATGFQSAMDTMCSKLAAKLVTSGVAGGNSAADAGLLQMWDVLKAGKATSTFAGLISSGDTAGAGKELLGLATDYTGIPGKALEYTLAGMQNALDVWRIAEVENAFKVFTQGSSGGRFGYGVVDAGDFETLWQNMKGASQQLIGERIAKENEARRSLGLPTLTTKEEDSYREKVKQELASEFVRRIELRDRIDLQKRNLDLIFTELDSSKLFEGTNTWIRKTDPKETLDSRLYRFNHLIERIFADLKIDAVYSGPQQEAPLNGRISAIAMTEMLRGYFAAKTQAEGDLFLQDYYKRFPERMIESIGGNWIITVKANETETAVAYTLTPSGPDGGTVTGGAGTFAYTFSGDTIVFKVTAEKPNERDYSETFTMKISPTARGYAGIGTMVQAYIAETRDSEGNVLTSEPVSKTWQITAVKASS